MALLAMSLPRKIGPREEKGPDGLSNGTKSQLRSSLGLGGGDSPPPRPPGGRLRRSATTFTHLGRRLSRDSLQQSSSQYGNAKNSEWNVGGGGLEIKSGAAHQSGPGSNNNKNMFLHSNDGPSNTQVMLQKATALASAVSTPALKSCLSVGSQSESLGKCYRRKSDDTTTAAAAAAPTMKKNVSFTSIEIREHPVTLGDNPSVSRGPPVSLDWYDEKTCQTESYDLDDYEDVRPFRRTKREIMLSKNLRESLLQDLAGTTKKEVTMAVKEANRIKKEREQTLFQLQSQGLVAEQKQLAMEKAKRKFQRLVGLKKSSKEEQDELWKQAAQYGMQHRKRETSLTSIPEKAQSLPVLRAGHQASPPRGGATQNVSWAPPALLESDE